MGRLASQGLHVQPPWAAAVAVTRPSTLQAFEERDEILDLVGFETKLGHGRMSGHDPLGKALLKCFDRIALVQSPERRGRLEAASASAPDGVTPCAMGLREGSASVHVLRVGGG